MVNCFDILVFIYLVDVKFVVLLLNQQRNFLVTVGEDEQISPQQSAMCLKVFDLDRMEPEGSSSVSPDCIGILRIFTNQFPEAKVVLLCPYFVLIFNSDMNLPI